MKQFNRIIRIEAVAPSGLHTVPEDLDISFTCRKTRSSTANELDIEIRNTNPLTRRVLSEDGAYVKISTGYEGKVSMLAQMDVARSSTSLEPPDTITKISCLDGLYPLKNKKVKMSFKKKVTAASVIESIIKQLGVRSRIIGVSLNYKMENGMTHAGPASEVLDDVLRDKASWGFVDGVLLITKLGVGTGELAFTISPENGLLASPEELDDAIINERVRPKQLKSNGYQLTMLMRPELNPYQTIEVKSKNVNGKFVVDMVEHVGSTRGGEFYTRATVYD